MILRRTCLALTLICAAHLSTAQAEESPFGEEITINTDENNGADDVIAAGCSDTELTNERGDFVDSLGSPPSTASGAWRFGYDLFLGLRRVIQEQGRRCNRPMTVEMDYVNGQIEGFEATGRAAGWL